MKKILSLLIVSFLVADTHAQHLSAGALTGSSYWVNTQRNEGILRGSVDGQHLSWDKGMFIRYDAKKGFGLQLGLTQNSLKYQSVEQSFDGEYSFSPRFFKANYVTVNLVAQHDLTRLCGCGQACPVLKKIKNYVGATISPTFVRNKTMSKSNTDGNVYAMNFTEFQVWAGVNNTLVYSFNEHVNLMSVVSIQMDVLPFGSSLVISTLQPDLRYSFQLGAAYKFR